MSLRSHVGPRTYYDYFPSGEHRPGDIWRDLPTNRLLRQELAAGVVITPSCDLANRKAPTITYLPVISCRAWFLSVGFSAEVTGTLQSLADSLPGAPGAFEMLEGVDEALLHSQAEYVRREFETCSEPAKRKTLERYAAGLRHLRKAHLLDDGQSLGDLALCLGAKRWAQVRQQLIRNALRGDLHFLPADEGSDDTTSAVPEHSVALFRYPVTVPIQVLDAAADPRLVDWPAAMDRLSSAVPCGTAFRNTRPLKCLRLQPRFLADLLTRYVALFSRLGSPDFSDETIAAYASDLEDQG